MNTDRILPVNREHLLLMQVLCWLGQASIQDWVQRYLLRVSAILSVGVKQYEVRYAMDMKHLSLWLPIRSITFLLVILPFTYQKDKL